MKIFLTIFLFPILSIALNINPAPVSGEISLTKSQNHVYFTNNTALPQFLSLSLQGSGFSIITNRCPSSLAKSQTCYIIVQVNPAVLPMGESEASLQNDSNEIVSLKYSKTTPYSGDSVFQVSSLNISDFGVKNVSILNQSSSVKSYSPTFSGTDASKFKLILNRCQNIEPNKSCIVSLQLKPQVAGSYSATLSDSQSLNSIAINASISSGALPPQVSSVSLSSSSISLGTVSKIGMSSSRNLVLTNNGNVALYPIIQLSSNLVSILNRCQISLLPGKSCSISVAFHSTLSTPDGEIAESISVKANSEASPQIVSVNGFFGQYTIPISCLDAKNKGINNIDNHQNSGVWEIDPDGENGNNPFQVYCDQETDGGGWTLAFESSGKSYGFKPGDVINANVENLHPCLLTADNSDCGTGNFRWINRNISGTSYMKKIGSSSPLVVKMTEVLTFQEMKTVGTLDSVFDYSYYPSAPNTHFLGHSADGSGATGCQDISHYPESYLFPISDGMEPCSGFIDTPETGNFSFLYNADSFSWGNPGGWSSSESNNFTIVYNGQVFVR